MTATPPVFGPTTMFPIDENLQPFAVVGLRLTVSREQLRAMLAIGHAERAGEPPLGELSVVDTRREIEGYLAASAVLELDREADDINGRLNPEHVAELDAAIERAYTVPLNRMRTAQTPVYGGGTVTLQTLDRGEVTVPEPAWCLGHDGTDVGTMAEISHAGPESFAVVESVDLGEIPLLKANLTQGPHLDQQPELFPLLAVEGIEPASFNSEQLRLVAARLVVFAGHLRDEARRLAVWEQGGQP
ncbi:hypothetical protein ABZ341_32555 [Streptomyces sp. NPDC006173]|uniref:DUF6907 domain-containing protein n=1 Tax=Streptomyces sp. NPDC006173 TaxID=3155349 RepID=UPI003403F63B